MSGSGNPLEPTLALQQPEGAALSGRHASFPLPVAAALRVLKNFLSQAGSSLLAQAFAFFSTAYVARCLRVEGFGWIGFAQGLLAYFTLMTDLGLRTVGMREVAKHHEDVPTCVGYILGLRLALAGISMAVFLAVVVLIPKSAAFKWFLAEYGFIILTSAVLLDWAFQGLERMELVALGEVLRAGSYLALVFVGLHRPSQILRIPIFTVLSQLLPVTLLLAIFWRSFQGIRPALDWMVWRDLLRQSLPISAGGLTLQLATGLDIVLLGFLRPASEVGYYNAAFRLVFMPTSFTTVLGFAMFPVMARYWKEQPEKLGSITTYLGRVLLLMGFPLVIAGWFFAPSVLTLVYGRGFLPATLCFRILLGFLLVSHIYTPFFYLLPACGKEKGFMKGMMAGAAFGLPANLILIPLYGAPGAALAKVLAYAVIVAYVYRLTGQEIAPVRLLNELSRSILVATPMVVLVWLVPGGWWVKLGVGLIVYLGLVALLEGKAWYALAGSAE
jgi:O-antigen/teichoic acid export membrane protein